ncbi:hypothetical protein JS518_15035 [Clostridiales bacterium FE2010]|nr:hypothetical protein JS518_15035 [Clostridiales bacterium FE2010]
MADQEFLASFAVDIDEAGVSRLQAILTENRELADSLAAAFNAASEAIRSFAEDLGILPNFSNGYGITTEGMSGFGGLAVGLDLSKAFSDYEAFTALVKQPLSLKVNTSGITSAARSAMSSVRSIFAEPVDIRFRADLGGEESKSAGTTLKMSTGGRFSSPTDVQVAEDGDAEYIIPVKKEEKALPLLRQLLSELSPAARESITNSGSGIQDMKLMPAESRERAGTILSGSLAAGEVGTTIYQTHQNVSAPVSIQVHASGTDPEQVGQSLYSMTERYLQRTLESAFS